MTETTQANEAADGQSQLTEVLGLTVQDIGCRLMQKHRLVDPDAFPVAEGVVVAVFDWGVRLAEPADMTNEWDCYTGNYVLPNAELCGSPKRSVGESERTPGYAAGGKGELE